MEKEQVEELYKSLQKLGVIKSPDSIGRLWRVLDSLFYKKTVFYDMETVLRNDNVGAIFDFIETDAFTAIKAINDSVDIDASYIDETAVSVLESEGRSGLSFYTSILQFNILCKIVRTGGCCGAITMIHHVDDCLVSAPAQCGVDVTATAAVVIHIM